MVRIRLQRFGKPHKPFYRIVAIDSKRKRNGIALEIIGTYNPFAEGKEKVKLKFDRLNYWLSVGAQPTEIVRDLIRLAKEGKT